MDKFKKTLQTRITIIALYNGIALLAFILGVFIPAAENKFISEFIYGFNCGIYIFVQLFLIFSLAKYIVALKNVEKLKALYIFENDERRKFISTQIGGLGINIIIGGLVVATIAAGFWNETVFLVLLCALGFSVLVKAGLKLYFNKKI